MEVTRTTVPGVGQLFDCATRNGQHMRVLVDRSGERHVFVYGPDDEITTISFDGDEADQLADILHSSPLPDRIAALERRVSELAGAGP